MLIEIFYTYHNTILKWIIMQVVGWNIFLIGMIFRIDNENIFGLSKLPMRIEYLRMSGIKFGAWRHRFIKFI